MSEKVQKLHQLKTNESNKSIRAFNKDIVVFIVDTKANKAEIKDAVEKLFDVKVDKVNTLITSTKEKKVRGRKGETKAFKKAMVTLKPGFSIEQ